MDIAYAKPAAGESTVGTFTYRRQDADWSASGELTRGHSGLVISALTLHSKGPSGVTGALMRRVQVGELLTAIRAQVAVDTVNRVVDTGGPTFTPGDIERPPRRGGRAALTDELLRDVAIAYLNENGPGMPAGAVKRIAVQFERPEETIRTWVTRARRDGWLGPSVKGRPGAEPGPRLLVAMQEGSTFIPTKETARQAEIEGRPSPEAPPQTQPPNSTEQDDAPISRRPTPRPIQSSVLGFAAANEALARSLWPKRQQSPTGKPGEDKPGDRPAD